MVAKRSGIYNWVLSMLLLAIYTICVPFSVSALCDDIVNASHYIFVINRYGVMLVAVSVCVTYLLCKADRDGYSYEFLLECFIDAGLIEGICAVLAFLLPTIKSVFIFFMRKFTGSYLYSNTWYITVRSYGFASTLVDVFGLGIGIVAGISFFYGVNGKSIYVLKSIVIAVATLLNSRTGLLIYFIAVFFSVVYVLIKGNGKKKFSIVVTVGVLAFFGIKILEVLSTNEATTSWFQSGIKSIERILSGEKLTDGTNDALSLLFQKSFWQLPNFPRIVIGTGHSLYLAQGYSHSDVGYINELWLFGIVGCIILYGTIVKICMNLIKSSNISVFKFAAFFLLVSYLFFNIKGAALGYNPGAVSMFFVLFVGNYYKKKEESVTCKKMK